MYVGIAVLVFGFARVHSGRESYDLTNSFRFSWTIAYVVLLMLITYAVGLPELARSPRQAVGMGALAAALGAGSVSILQLFVGDALLPRFVVFGGAIAVVPWTALCSAAANRFRSQAQQRDRVVVVSERDDLVALEADLGQNPERPVQIVAALAPDLAASSGGVDKPLVATVVEHGATVVVLDRVAQADESIVAQAGTLHENGVRVRTLSLFYEQWLAKLPTSELERVSLMFDIGEIHRIRYSRLSRVLDVTAATAGAVVLAPLMLVVAVVNPFLNRGPLFFRQERVGRNGHRFQILKFRTMTEDASSVGEWTGEDDPRITRFGGVLRRTHLDELPQVLNILRGDLSVVGPRPEQPHYVAELSQKLPFYEVRHLVRPGLTGWAQVKYGYAGDEKDALEKLQYEFWYLRHQDLALDIRIIGRTVRSILGSEGGGR